MGFYYAPRDDTLPRLTYACFPIQEPCPGKEYRFHYIIRMGMDSMIQSFMLNVMSLASNTSSTPPGLDDGRCGCVQQGNTADDEPCIHPLNAAGAEPADKNDKPTQWGGKGTCRQDYTPNVCF